MKTKKAFFILENTHKSKIKAFTENDVFAGLNLTDVKNEVKLKAFIEPKYF